jgi:branched-chain amino acid transport system permease protein
MEVTSSELSTPATGLKSKILEMFSGIPILGWLFGILIAVILEQIVGTQLAWALGLPKIPALFGFLIMLKEPMLVPSSMLYVLLIFILPISVVARLSLVPANRMAERMINLSMSGSVLVHLVILYAIFHIWSGMSDYRLISLKFTLIAIMVTVSLNVINGYMGEFSCSHPGFMALGAYTASVFSVSLFVNDSMFGHALMPSFLGPFLFPIGLIFGGCVAAVGALIVAIPSFRTRGDYLAIISLAFMFIVKSLIENLEFVGGPRGLSSQPGWANLPTVFAWTVVCIWVINNFVRSTLGKALNAIRDEETAANAMTVNTRRTKVVAFMFSAFWAGVAGGLFAHVLGYVNPGSFSIQKLAEVLAMVYFGGLNSVYGSIVGAVSLSLLGEALRPLELFKWIAIPLLLILVMIYRPTGLIAFKEFNVKKLIQPKKKKGKGV